MLDGGVLDEPGQDTGSRPQVIEEFIEILNDPESYPILIHCKAGLHRTGLMTAIYRMEKEKRSTAEAVRELRANGFGTFGATDGNEYIRRYFLPPEIPVRKGER
jgi:protein tyrosine/serine phosphatase